MKFKSPLFVVTDMKKSVEFYKTVLGLHVTMDLGANVTLTGGLALQTMKSWQKFIDDDDIVFGGKDAEIYFEEDDFDTFAEKLKSLDVDYVHDVKEHSWGQRVVRIYDPDKHIIEIGENMMAVCKRFADEGMTVEQIAERMNVPINFVKRGIK